MNSFCSQWPPFGTFELRVRCIYLQHYPTKERDKGELCYCNCYYLFFSLFFFFSLFLKYLAIVVDACAVCHRVLDEVHGLIDRTGLLVLVTLMGKGAVNETDPGVYMYVGDGRHLSSYKPLAQLR